MSSFRGFAVALATIHFATFAVRAGFAVPADAEILETHINWAASVHRRNIQRRGSIETGVGHQFSIGDFNGYGGEFDPDTIAEIEQNEDVLLVEPDMVGGVTTIIKQTEAPWGLESISSRVPAVNSSDLGGKYTYDSSAGAGTFAYVFDTGITIEATQFEGRAVRGFNPWPNDAFEDSMGHGTHVAGTVGSKTYGVAKKATIIDVKAARSAGYSTTGTVITCLDWTVANITNSPGRLGRSVINMSLAFPTSISLNLAIEAAYKAGVLSVVGAGNDGRDASTRSPASAPLAVTVGGIDQFNNRPTWSNFGPLVDVFAPAVRVVSTWFDRIEEVDGTSMASPHVAGLALYLIGVEGARLASPAALAARIKELGTKNVIQNVGAGSPNLLAYNGVNP